MPTTANKRRKLHPAIDEMVRRIVAGFDPDKIILFGSYARGTAGPDSDADLLIVMDFEGKRRSKVVEIYGAVGGLGLPKDIFLVSPDELSHAEPGSIAASALQEGIHLYDRTRIRT
jgi:predicted nucleotidyltransferase